MSIIKQIIYTILEYVSQTHFSFNSDTVSLSIAICFFGTWKNSIIDQVL